MKENPRFKENQRFKSDETFSKMGKWLKNTLFGPKNGRAPLAKTRRISLEHHGLAPERMSQGALSVVDKLKQAGFQAYIVGGAIRDLLLQLSPKDFDVATDATPEEVRALFRRAIIIGRRFRLVHVYVGDEKVEVSTFRRSPEAGEEGREANNLYGTHEEDARRRDFSANALYYCPRTGEIIDFTLGFSHIQERRLTVIGDPEERYQEDPMRMVRALRFAAKSGLFPDVQALAPIARLAPLIAEVPPARRFDEFLKILLSGASAKALLLLQEQGILAYFLPFWDEALEEDRRLRTLCLAQTDRRFLEGKPVSPTFILAALLWGAVRWRQKKKEDEGMPASVAFEQAQSQVLQDQVRVMAIPRRLLLGVREIWSLVSRLQAPKPRLAASALAHPRLRAGLDFLALRAEAGEEVGDALAFWQAYLDANEEERKKLLASLSPGGGRKRRRRRKKKAPSALGDAAGVKSGTASGEPQENLMDKGA